MNNWKSITKFPVVWSTFIHGPLSYKVQGTPSALFLRLWIIAVYWQMYRFPPPPHTHTNAHRESNPLSSRLLGQIIAIYAQFNFVWLRNRPKGLHLPFASGECETRSEGLRAVQVVIATCCSPMKLYNYPSPSRVCQYEFTGPGR